MGTHEQCVGATDEWYTPPYVFDAMGVMFDLDVAHPGPGFAEWVPAKKFYHQDGLGAQWELFAGLVWMNPPFGGRNGIVLWLEKFFEHGNGVALVPDRTSAPWWQKFAPRADLVLFVSPKIKFIGRDGKPGKSPAQGTVLLAVGPRGCGALQRAAHAKLGVLFRPERS